MANGHGGRRSGAGRPRKSLADKKLEGLYGKRRPTVLNFPESAEEYKLEYPVWLDGMDSNWEGVPNIRQFWNSEIEYLEKTGCLHLINPSLIANYVIALLRLAETERAIAISNTVYQSKMRDIRVDAHPLVEVAKSYRADVSTEWDKIWKIIQQNSETYYGDDPSHDIMSRLLSNKPR